MARRQRQYGNVLFSALRAPTSKLGTEEGKGRRKVKSHGWSHFLSRVTARGNGLQGFTRLTLTCNRLITFLHPPRSHYRTAPARGQMLLEGRKHSRRAERFLAQVSSVHDPLLTELASVEDQSPCGVRLATQRSWELGSHVDVKSVVGNLKVRARVVYCAALGPKKFVVGLNILSRGGEQGKPPARD